MQFFIFVYNHCNKSPNTAHNPLIKDAALDVTYGVNFRIDSAADLGVLCLTYRSYHGCCKLILCGKSVQFWMFLTASVKPVSRILSN